MISIWISPLFVGTCAVASGALVLWLLSFALDADERASATCERASGWLFVAAFVAAFLCLTVGRADAQRVPVRPVQTCERDALAIVAEAFPHEQPGAQTVKLTNERGFASVDMVLRPSVGYGPLIRFTFAVSRNRCALVAAWHGEYVSGWSLLFTVN